VVGAADLQRRRRGHVLFGSNHPAWPAADCLADLPGLRLDEEAAELFLHGNAERVFGLKPGARRESTG
jgi:uncharacterized protein